MLNNTQVLCSSEMFYPLSWSFCSWIVLSRTVILIAELPAVTLVLDNDIHQSILSNIEKKYFWKDDSELEGKLAKKCRFS